MNTQNINVAPENGSNESKSNKAKTIGIKAAKFAAAAGVGAVGTIAANAMGTEAEEEEVVEATLGAPVEAHEVDAEEIIEEPETFDPNEIRLEPEPAPENASEGQPAEPKPETAVSDEPKPISSEDLLIEKDNLNQGLPEDYYRRDEIELVEIEEDIYTPEGEDPYIDGGYDDPFGPDLAYGEHDYGDDILDDILNA